MASIKVESNNILINTTCYYAQVATRGYVSGVKGRSRRHPDFDEKAIGGSFVDKATGARDLGYGLGVVDFWVKGTFVLVFRRQNR